MSKEKVLKHLEDLIRISVRQVKKARVAKAEQLKHIAAVANAYTRLLYKSEEIDPPEKDPNIEGTPGFYEKMVENQQ